MKQLEQAVNNALPSGGVVTVDPTGTAATDTANIRAAVRDAKGGAVRLGAGTLVCDSFPLSISGLTVTGASRGATTLLFTGASAQGIYTDNLTSPSVGSGNANFLNYFTIADLTLDMARMAPTATTAAIRLQYSFGNVVNRVNVVHTSGANNALWGKSGLYTTDFYSCVFPRVYLQGQASPETITTLNFYGLDCTDSIQMESCSTIRFYGPTIQGSGIYHFQMTGCTDIYWDGGDYESSNYAGAGTISCTAGAATFSVAQGSIYIVNGGMVVIGGVPYLVSNYNAGAQTCTLVGYPGTVGAGSSPTFGASAFQIGTVLFRFVGAGNQNMNETRSTLNGFRGAFKTGAPSGGRFQSEFNNTQNTDQGANQRYLRDFGGNQLFDTLTGWWSRSGALPRSALGGGYDLGTLNLLTDGNVNVTGGAWNSGHCILGAAHLWIDSANRLRIKSGAPTFDTDGVVVGTQT